MTRETLESLEPVKGRPVEVTVCEHPEPDDLALRRALDAARARQCRLQIERLEASGGDEQELAALYAEAGDKDKTQELLGRLGRLGGEDSTRLLRVRSGMSRKQQSQHQDMSTSMVMVNSLEAMGNDVMDDRGSPKERGESADDFNFSPPRLSPPRLAGFCPG